MEGVVEKGCVMSRKKEVVKEEVEKNRLMIWSDGYGIVCEKDGSGKGSRVEIGSVCVVNMGIKYGSVRFDKVESVDVRRDGEKVILRVWW